MIDDASALGEAPGPVDVAIVGGGAAGLAMAQALIGSGLSVLLLEAGGRKEEKAVQDAYRGELADPLSHPYPHTYRRRALGGTSRIWGGRCIPFDPVDFESRPWAPGPGWPIPLQSLEPYYRKAQDAAEAGPFDYDPATALPGRQAAIVPALEGAVFETRLERFSKPTDLWRRYGAELTAAANVRIATHAAVTAVRLASDGATTDHLEVERRDGRRVKVKARAYVLAAGGLETVRLLLASNDVQPSGVGSGSGALGRYYMSHLAATSGVIRFKGDPASIAFDYERDAQGVYVRRRLQPTEPAQREHRLLNTIFRTHLPDPADPAHGDPILSAMYLVKDLVLFEYSRKMRASAPTLASRLRHAGNVAGQPLRLARFGRKWVGDRILAERKLPSVVLGSADNAYALEFHAEQAPNPDSRLTLTSARDRHGLPRLKIDWRTLPQDHESLEAAYRLLEETLRTTGAGVLDWSAEALRAATLEAGAYGGHHLGAARMSLDPAQGVVDIQGRVHGVSDLYVASGAVFPTSSQANPTLTILALSFRLADHLATTLGSVHA